MRLLAKLTCLSLLLTLVACGSDPSTQKPLAEQKDDQKPAEAGTDKTGEPMAPAPTPVVPTPAPAHPTPPSMPTPGMPTPMPTPTPTPDAPGPAPAPTPTPTPDTAGTPNLSM
jgi:hypothetical protein